MSLSMDPEAPCPKDRLLELDRDATESVADLTLPDQIFSCLSHVDTFDVFSEKCPFMHYEEVLTDFWTNHLMENDAMEEPFAHEYQDVNLARYQYGTILGAIGHFKSPMRRLVLDAIPVGAFELLYEGMASDIDNINTR